MRIASVPSGHVYVRHLSSLDGHGPERLPDPRPVEAAHEQQWWPPVMLQPGWISEHASEFDVFHVHFGFDALGPDELRSVVRQLRAVGRPLVYTVHDLVNPHHEDPEIHTAALDVLIREADVLITLTRGAAHEIWRRWGRLAHVLPHPHVVGLEDMAVPRPEPAGNRVGIHLKSMRANMDPLPLLPLLAGLSAERELQLVVDVHTDVVTAGQRNHSPEVVAALGDLERRGAEVHVHDYYSDRELWDYFRSLELSVLPYRFGTHSGWLEACFDLGTRVLAPRIGFYHDQEPGVLGYRIEAGRPVAADVAAALDAVTQRIPWGADRGWRRAQRAAVATAHEAIYESLVTGGAP